MVLDLIDNAPFEFMWLNTFGATAARDALVKAITDSSVSLEEAMDNQLPKLRPYTTQLLALRGFVAFGVLEHWRSATVAISASQSPIRGRRRSRSPSELRMSRRSGLNSVTLTFASYLRFWDIITVDYRTRKFGVPSTYCCVWTFQSSTNCMIDGTPV
ncbi:hypothetical protein V7S43_014159 [Phytophthora oleae]|uniref:Uncharacterized protein n=1 Tax=Phytophthora oleae TaxID=2107226 RepID=A0ABD3F2M3_9STRA